MNMKKILPSWLLVSTLYACNSAKPTNETIVRQYFDRFNQHDWKAMAALYADTALFKDPSLGTVAVQQTRAQTVARYSQLQQMIPNVADSIVQLYHANECVVVEFISTGTVPDGKPFTLPICTIFKIQQGKIVEDFTYYDNE